MIMNTKINFHGPQGKISELIFFVSIQNAINKRYVKSNPILCSVRKFILWPPVGAKK